MADTWKSAYQQTDSNQPYSRSNNLMTNKIAKIIRVTGVIIAIAGVIAGIVLGNTFPILKPRFEGSMFTDEIFNFGLFAIAMLSSVISGVLVVGFSELIEKVSLCHDALQKLSQQNQQ